MQTLFVKHRTADGFKFYPAMRAKRLSKRLIADTLANLISAQWDILFYSVQEDGMTRAEDERQYRSLCRAERRRAA